MNRQLQIPLHVLLWAISFFLLYKLFTVDYDSGVADLIYTALFHLPLFLAVYGNLLLVRTFFSHRKYILYAFSCIILGFISVSFHFLLFKSLVPLFLKNYYFIAYYSFWQIAQFVSAYIFLSLLFHLSVEWFRLKEKEYILQRENHLVQLTNLKSQLNPHFLFNSLNNIYGLAGKDNVEVRDYLTRLSDALRYMIYDTDSEFVPLKSEVIYLGNYFELEKLRLGKSGDIIFTRSGPFDQYVIAPLLMLPLLENCFRHCDRKSPYIKVDLTIKDDRLILKTENNRTGGPAKPSGGVGLRNVRKRLELIYGDSGRLQILDQPLLFQLTLQINLSPQA